MPAHQGKFVIGRVSKIQFSPKIPQNGFSHTGDQMLRGRGNYDPLPILFQVDDAFQRPFFPCLLFHISYAVQELLTMTARKRAAQLNDASNLSVPDLQARRAEPPCLAARMAGNAPLPDSILK